MDSDPTTPHSKSTLTHFGRRHICAFFHNQDEEYQVLLPFIKKGFEKNEKAFHIVDPKLKREHMRRLETAGIDVKAAEERRQLEVKVWDEAYLKNGRFDQNAMVNLIKELLKTGRSQGFAATRGIAHMEWILEDRPAVEDFLEYETRLNDILKNYNDPILCVYNVAKFDAGIVMDILRTHPVVMIAGVMHRNPFFIPPDELLEEIHARRDGAESLDAGLTAENRKLRQAIRDLVALSSMPATWIERECKEIAEETIDVLMSGLQLEVAYIRLKRGDGTAEEIVRSGNSAEFKQWLRSPVTGKRGVDEFPALRKIELATESGILHVIQIPIGIETEAGFIAVGSSRADFPTETEATLLYVAANQGFAAFQNARLSHERQRAEGELRVLKEDIGRISILDEEIIGSSSALASVLSNVARVAPTDSTVLISGETGTGKECVAKAIHMRSKRAAQPFVSVNCAVLPVTLIASELFGHEKGAFTGALQRRLGRFELANGGTIFLDEVGEIPLETQVMLLRVLQERTFERVGGSQQIFVDVRVLAATNRDVQAAIAAGTFRSDLFYRLNVFPITVPPLRERKEDIPALVRYFVDRYAAQLGKKIRTIERGTMELLQSYHWPGNIRELQNVVERSLILSDVDTFSVDVAWLVVDAPHGKSGSLLERVETYEKEIIENALKESKGKVAGSAGASKRLGIPPTTLESRIKALNIDKNHFRR